MDEQPVETTLYSLDESPPRVPDRRHGDRWTGEKHLSLLRVGSLTIAGRRELCLIRNVSAGGMLIRAYCAIAPGTPLTIELKQGEPVRGAARWVKDGYVGVTFDEPVDVIALLSSSADGPRPRMPRIEIDTIAWVRVDATVHRTRAVNISQGGLKVGCRSELPVDSDVIVSLDGLDPRPGRIRWRAEGEYGINFNRVLPLPVLVAWLQERHERRRAAG
ncbi:MAG TPA: PilZ domain-containing protein [Sphingomicrobium sp.]